MRLSVGTRLGPYEIVALIGAGGMGEVYRARDTRLDRNVAIKVLPASLSSQPASLERFRREARAASALNHPNICALSWRGAEALPSGVTMSPADLRQLPGLAKSGKRASPRSDGRPIRLRPAGGTKQPLQDSTSELQLSRLG
jgi:serine/threonine protein kinase